MAHELFWVRWTISNLLAKDPKPPKVTVEDFVLKFGRPDQVEAAKEAPPPDPERSKNTWLAAFGITPGEKDPTRPATHMAAGKKKGGVLPSHVRQAHEVGLAPPPAGTGHLITKQTPLLPDPGFQTGVL